MKTSRRAVLVTGADAAFAPWMFSCLDSLADTGVLDLVDLAVLDQGLTADQTASLGAYNAAVAAPDWPDFVPRHLRSDKTIGLTARPFLRDYFPGYDIYIWFDADAWAQTSDFLACYIDGARSTGAAVARENGHGYSKSFAERRWWVGNHVLAFGLKDGLRLALQPSINIGIVALTADAPHWQSWVTHYTRTIERTGKINLDQHALQAAMCLDGPLPVFVDAANNWLPILSTPYWDAARCRLCDPGPRRTPLSVVHLAGPDKRRPYTLHGPTALTTSLDYASFRHHLQGRKRVPDDQPI